MAAQILACTCLAAGVLPADSRAEDSETVLQRFVSMAIQGDLTGAAELFASDDVVDDPALSALGRQFRERFHPDVAITGGAGFSDGVTRAYHAYWRDRLLLKVPAETADRQLQDALSRLLPRHTQERHEARDIFTRMRVAYGERGLGSYDSPDPPLRDLFLWREETARRYAVRLTDGVIDLEVRFLDGLLLQGWKDYATLGLASTTGWVDDGVLYCLGWAYDRESENFNVSYLKHEARHLVDLQRWPEMDSTELEYRAKLTEIAFANRSVRRVLTDFASKAARNPASPHAMANWRIVRDVHWEVFGAEMPEGFSDWQTVGVGKLNRAARGLLVQNTQMNEAAAGK